MEKNNQSHYPHAFVYKDVFKIFTGGKGVYGAYTAEDLKAKTPLDVLNQLTFLTREKIQELYNEHGLMRPLSPEEQAVMSD